MFFRKEVRIMKKYKKRQRGANVVKVGRFWYSDYSDPVSGERIFKSLRTQSKGEAERIVAERLYKRRRVAEGIDKPRPERNLAQLLEEYQDYIGNGNRRRASTVRHHKTVLRQFERFLDCEMSDDWHAMRLDDLDLRLFEAWQTWRLSCGRKPSSVNCERMVLNAVLNYAVKHGYLSENPCGMGRLEKLLEKDAPVRYLHSDQIEQMREVLKDTPDLLDFFEIAVGTGLRCGEILHLRWVEDVDWHTGHVRVQPQDAWQPKTKHSIRDVKMSPTVRDVLKSRFAERGTGIHVFGGDKPWSHDRVSRPFREAYRKAGITGRNLHSLRHSFGTCAIRSGIDLYTLSRLMGHASVETTQRYGKVTQAQLDAAIGKLSLDAVKPSVLPRNRSKLLRICEAQKSAERKSLVYNAQ